jgi:beta-1,4-N-acetylglucosaminyltransferase
MGDRRRILLVCSPGGHLLQLLALAPAFHDCDCTWVTLRSLDTTHLLAGERVAYAHGPTNRSVKNLARNVAVAWRVITEQDPHVILSTGAGLAVPFFAVGKLRRRRLVFVESVTRVNSLSLSGTLVYLLADAFFVQSRALTRLRRARYAGDVL